MMKLSLEIFGTEDIQASQDITSELDSLDGVENVIINIENRSGEILYNPDIVTSDDILSIISKHGYQAQVVTNAE